MTKPKAITMLFLVTLFLIPVISCKTSYDRKNPYPNMEILRYSDNHAYVFPNEGSDKLLIIFEGNGWNSVLGIKQGNKWTYVQYGSQFLQELNNTYTILIPEKLKRRPGMVYSGDIEDRANYTVENLLTCYTESINGYLAEHNYSSVVLIGTSEGAALLPLIYERMVNKGNVTAMVSISFGGLSLYESYTILSERSNTPPGWYEMYFNITNLYYPEKNEFRDSFSEDFYGTTFRYLNSFIYVRPFDYYQYINIPILFVHGYNDYTVPVESTEYIQKSLPEKPFEYKYFPWHHQPDNLKELIQFRKEISEWIKSL